MEHGSKTPPALQELRAKIERGRYEVKPDRVAVAMIRRGLNFGPPRPAAPRG